VPLIRLTELQNFLITPRIRNIMDTIFRVSKVSQLTKQMQHMEEECFNAVTWHDLCTDCYNVMAPYKLSCYHYFLPWKNNQCLKN